MGLGLNLLAGHDMDWWEGMMTEFFEEMIDAKDVDAQVLAIADQIMPQLRELLPALDLDDPAVLYDVLTVLFLGRSWLTYAETNFFMTVYAITEARKKASDG